MPITDSDLATVNRVKHGGSNEPIEIEIEWKDAQGISRGTFTSSWANTFELREFLESQGSDDVVRAVMVQCLNRQTGALRATVFDALPGKTFEIQQKVVQK